MSLEDRWKALGIPSATDVFQLYDAAHPLDVYLGKGALGQLLLLLVTSDDARPSREFRAISLESYRRDDGRWSLLFRLTNADFAPLFSLLCEDLIESSRAISDKARPVAFFMRRFNNWQRMLDKGHSGILSESEIRGLCGELLALETLILPQLGPVDATRAWVGPDGAAQDFQLVGTAWEIKTIRPGGRTVRISTEDQLYSETRQIELIAICLDNSTPQVAGAFTLNSLIRRIGDTLSISPQAIEAFEASLAAAGYTARAEYDGYVLIFVGMRRYKVTLGFPLLGRKQMPQGVSAVSYDLSLADCENFLI